MCLKQGSLASSVAEPSPFTDSDSKRLTLCKGMVNRSTGEERHPNSHALHVTVQCKQARVGLRSAGDQYCCPAGVHGRACEGLCIHTSGCSGALTTWPVGGYPVNGMPLHLERL